MSPVGHDLWEATLPQERDYRLRVTYPGQTPVDDVELRAVGENLIDELREYSSELVVAMRILRSDDFYPTINRDNVSMVTEGIEEIPPKAIRTADGVEHEFDVIIYATSADDR